MRHIIFNKPFGVLSQFTDEGTSHPTLKQFINVPNVYPAGRLDRDSEGLLILSDDGEFIKLLTDPRHHIEKTYFVMVEGDVTSEKITKLSSGIILKDHVTLPTITRIIPNPDLPPRPKMVTPHGPTSWIEMRLKEGKKRQIRHMTAAVKLFTLRLFRIAIGEIQLGNLQVGRWRDLTPGEVQILFNAAWDA